jgi:hypothetical protein
MKQQISTDFYTVLTTISCSGSLSKRPWLAFIGNNWLTLNDSINSLWLTLIDAENILAHIK